MFGFRRRSKSTIFWWMAILVVAGLIALGGAMSPKIAATKTVISHVVDGSFQFPQQARLLVIGVVVATHKKRLQS